MGKTSQTPVNTGTRSEIQINYGDYLSTAISSLPSGKIDKQYPGIGATYLEINDKSRSSIIVFPTRALAATKAKQHNIHYLGSEFQGSKGSTVNQIMSDIDAGQCVKIAVVADSLVNLYERIKPKLMASGFFILLDEIDSFQTESNYRPKLEECIDIYFEFPKDRRAVVSATIELFSRRDFRFENVTTIVVKDYKPPKLKLVNATRNALKVTAEEIIERSKDGKKVFIALNSIEGILKVLSLLPKDLVAESGILCSHASRKKVVGYAPASLVNGLLEYKITFFTSAFFVGVDILEPKGTVHLIMVADTTLPVSLLSLSKTKQIIGRIRLGDASNTLIINCSDGYYQQSLVVESSFIQRQKAYNCVLEAIESSFFAIGLREEAREIQEAMLETCRVDNVLLLRRVGDKVRISDSSIDHLRIKYRMNKLLYRNIRNATSNFKKHFEIAVTTIHSDVDEKEQTKMDKVVDGLKDVGLANSRFILINQISDSKQAISNAGKIQADIWKAAGPCIDKAKLTNILIPYVEKDSARDLNKLLFQVRVFSQDDQSPLWKHLNMHFIVGQKYTPDQVLEGLDQTRKALGRDCPIEKYSTSNTAIRAFNQIYITRRAVKGALEVQKRKIFSTRRGDFC